MVSNINLIKGMLFGIAIGDALGVPVEFKNREYLKKYPVKKMIGYGTHNQKPGTFSDDSSLSFILVETLISSYDLNLLGKNIVRWYDEGYWTPNKEVCDIGNTTLKAIENLKKGIEPNISGENNERDNGNGSLMRIAPLIFFTIENSKKERFKKTKEISSITHRHIRSIISCFYFLEYIRYLIKGLNKLEAYEKLKTEIIEFLNSIKIDPSEINHLKQLLEQNIYTLPENKISTSGSVISTLEASMWCFLNTNSYKESVLKAVNLGNDTDTTAAVTGAISGTYYGFDSIPKEWIKKIAKSSDIENLAIRFEKSLNKY